MEWAYWIGSTVFAVTIGGMIWMRNRPIRNADGDVVDDVGRPVNNGKKLSNDAVIVLRALRTSPDYLSGYDLRRHVDHLSRQEFYALIAELESRELINNRIEEVGGHNVRRYFLTDYGVHVVDS